MVKFFETDSCHTSTNQIFIDVFENKNLLEFLLRPNDVIVWINVPGYQKIVNVLTLLFKVLLLYIFRLTKYFCPRHVDTTLLKIHHIPLPVL